ncbi:hypothetical protein ARSEF4850_007382 [Beauveria asiatica]
MATPESVEYDLAAHSCSCGCESCGYTFQRGLFTAHTSDPAWYAAAYDHAPKLDRMMTDVFDDETYEPNSIITPPSPVSPQSAGSFGNNQLLSASNRQQLSALQTPTPKASRGPSPFRATSTHAPIQSLDSSGSLIPCQGLQNNNHGLYAKLEPDPLTPRTISPGDTMFDFIEEDFESDFGLFPEIATEFDLELYGKASQETKWDKYPFSWTQAASSRSIGTHHDTAVQLQKYNDENLADAISSILIRNNRAAKLSPDPAISSDTKKVFTTNESA